MRTIHTLTATLAALLLAAGAEAAESRLTGRIQAQVAYDESAADAAGWTLRTPRSWLGVEAVESVGGSRYVGVAQANVDALADTASARQFYLEWRLPVYQLRAGRAATLEKRHLVEPVALMHAGDPAPGADPDETGTRVAGVTGAFADRLLQVDISTGEVGFVSLEWQLAEADSEAEGLDSWALATGLDTPEGKLVLSYREADGEDEGLWGSSVRWEDTPWVLTGAHLYRGETLAWDLGLRYQSGQVVTKLSYGRDAADDSEDPYWALGFDQEISASVRNFSEVRWQPETERWLWQTGFQLSF